MPTNPYTLQKLPSAPDTSFTGYQKETGGSTRFTNFFDWIFGNRSYQDWVSQKQTEYNNAVQNVEYNNQLYYDWLSSPSGQRSLYENAGYNPNFVSDGGSGSSSGLAGSGTMSPAGVSAPVQSDIGNPLSILGEILPIMTSLAQIKNINAKTAGQEISNRWLDVLNGGKIRNLNLGSDRRELEMSSLLTQIYGDKIPSGLMKFGASDYLVGDEFKSSFDFQQEVQALNLMKARTQLVNAQSKMQNLNSYERDYLNKNYLPLMIDVMQGKKDLQDIEKQLQSAKVSNTGVNTGVQIIGALTNLLRIFL